MPGNVAEMSDTAAGRRSADQDIAALKEWKAGHSEQCEEREMRTADRFERIETRFDTLERYLRGIGTKLIWILLTGGAFAVWEVVSPHIHLQ